jgi:hypothetical protein
MPNNVDTVCIKRERQTGSVCVRSPVLFSHSFATSSSLSTGKPVILKSVELIYQRRKVHSVFATDSFSLRIHEKQTVFYSFSKSVANTICEKITIPQKILTKRNLATESTVDTEK